MAKSDTNLAEALALDIQGRLTTDRLSPGDAFMTEGQVAENYDVSRNIVREAISRLRALGILDSRQRKGLIVTQPDPVRLLSSAIPLYGHDKAGLMELARFRYTIEVGAIELAVAHATEQQVVNLIKIASRHLALKSDTLSNLPESEENQIELDFHTLILEMTASPLIAGIHQVLAEYFRVSEQCESTWASSRPESAHEHFGIAKAISHRDTELSRALIRQHLRPLRELMQSEP